MDDLIIGAQFADPGGTMNRGETYVLFGPLSAGTLDLTAAADIIVNGIDFDDQSGADVGSGDINGDGVDDLIIGAHGPDPGGRRTAGETYVLFGPLSAGILELATAADVTVNGIDANDNSGLSVGSGDIDGDGVDDLIIGALGGDPGGRGNAGESYVLFGPLSAGTLELSTAADITVNGIDAGDSSGVDIGSGDINNDGVDDLIIGASGSDPGGKTDAGEIYVLFGRAPTATPPPTPEPSAPTAVDGLVSWWPGDGNANDIVGGNDGGLMGGATFVAGKVDQAFSFDGVDDFVLAPTSANLNITGDVTVHLWAKRSVFGRAQMVAKGAGDVGTADAPAAFTLGFTSNDQLTATFERADGSNVFLLGSKVPDTGFHHYAYVRSDNNHRLFMDGAVVASGDFRERPGDTSGLPLTIGALRDDGDPTGFRWHFGGVIDEVQIFDSALSAAEIEAIYHAGSAGKVGKGISNVD